ncbi:MAG: glycosyltransferase family 92 protein [Verrucomicrobia bacterium]|nr:glycosyltransferase family 92 protein [Verrucomicrobiota bacterium]
MIRRAVLFIFLSCIAICHAEEPDKTPYKYNLSVCAVFKNEAKYLKEWIEYHRLIGVDHFYLYNNRSTDIFYVVLNPYIRQGIVTLIDWPDYLDKVVERYSFLWPLCVQVPAYENAIKYAALGKTRWLVCMDIDEYLVPGEHSSLTSILEENADAPGVKLASDYYNAAQVNVIPKRKLLIETIERIAKPQTEIERAVVKTIFKPELCTSFTWPPYECNFKDGQKAIELPRREVRINQYVNRYKGRPFLDKLAEKLHVDNRSLSDKEMQTLLDTGYEIDDQERAIYRFVPDLCKKLKIDTIENK